jgi:Tfp pilus assembly protein PilW
MHMIPRTDISSIVRADDGATLVETLVAIVMGVLVIGALCGILVISLHQSKRTTDRVDANQRGRIAMTKIVNELHSACLAPNFAPIKPESTENELRFVNAYSKEAVIPLSEVHEHRIIYSAETLRDYQYTATGGAWPSYTFTGAVAAPSGGTLLASHVTKTESNPIFSYYKYATTASNGSATESSSTLTSLGTAALTTLTAPTAASVLINFTVAPSNGSTQRGRTVPFASQVTLAFSSPSSETPIQAAPCE